MALSLPPGMYQYKFVVDGTWTAAPSQPTVDDGTGNLNNLVVAGTRRDEEEGDF